MPERLWSFKDLARFLRFEDPEVRYWAADRLARHYPKEATDLLAAYLFDDHDLTPELVASHLGRHGGPAQIAVLARGVTTLRGASAARALEALVRLRAPDSLERVHQAFDRRDFDEECWSFILEALAERGDTPASKEFQAFLKKRADWFGSPSILSSALKVTQPGEYRALQQAWIRSLQWKGAGGGDTGEAFRVLMDHLQVDDCGWCFRTNLRGRIDFERTLKAIESAYNCELRAPLGESTVRGIAQALEAGAFEESAAILARTIKERAKALAPAPGDDLLERIVEATVYWADPEVVASVEALGPHLREWVIGLLISTVVKMASYRNSSLEVRRSAGDLEALLPLLEVETSFMLDSLPQAIRKAVEATGETGAAARPTARRVVEDRCLAILASRGPFFPQAMALETLGELRSIGAVNEIIDFLEEENSYLYEAAEHALAKLEEAVIEPARARLEADNLEEDSGHSLLIILCELGTPEALKTVLEHLDFFVEAAGPGNTARWASLFGAKELLEPLRRNLPKDTAMVGQAMLLLGAVHNLRVSEESAIRRAIDDFWKKHPEEGEGGDESGPGDKYLM